MMTKMSHSQVKVKYQDINIPPLRRLPPKILLQSFWSVGDEELQRMLLTASSHCLS